VTSGHRRWRLLVDLPADGAWNMAVDDALLERAAADEEFPPTLRVYGWEPAALSLGRNQAADGAHDPNFLRSQSIDLVRRPTGGSAVLHEHERTYAVVARLGREPFPSGVVETYGRIAGVLRDALGRLGLNADEYSPSRRAQADSVACFSAPSAHEIGVAGRKLIGSAQRRRRRAFLQHGSILCRADPQRLSDALGASGSVPEGFTDLESVLGRSVEPAALDQALIDAFAAGFSSVMERSGRPVALSEETTFRRPARACPMR
jgi:lipoate-protein ligase A